MHEINIARTIAERRKAKGITQEQLAEYMGVSKASVSKWETGQSFPDIAFLPELATYFNITVDALIGYEPQMTGEDIRTLYCDLAEEFAEKPFARVMDRCRKIVRKYYSCYPLLTQMSRLYLNHFQLAGTQEEQQAVVAEARDLCARVTENCRELEVVKEANFNQAMCELQLRNPAATVELLQDVNDHILGEEVLLSGAYLELGQTDKSLETMQVGVLRHLYGIFGDLPNFLIINAGDRPRFEEIVSRSTGLMDLFHLDDLHPGMAINIYVTAAAGYLMLDDPERAMDMLDRYAAICMDRAEEVNSLHGDDFFDRVDGWLDALALGAMSPRSPQMIRRGMVEEIKNHPGLRPLVGNPRFDRMITRLEERLLQPRGE